MTPLDTPDIRQRDTDDCGEAARDCVLRFLGVRGAARQIATATDGTHPSTMEAAFRLAGVLVQSGTMSVADLQHHTTQGRPVVCPVALHGGHWVTIRGVARGFVYFQCSVDGRLQLKLAAWLDIWRDSTRAGHDFDAWGIAVGK